MVDDAPAAESAEEGVLEEPAPETDASAFFEPERNVDLPLPAGIVTEFGVGDDASTGEENFGDAFDFNEDASDDVLMLPEINDDEMDSELTNRSNHPTWHVSSRPVILRRLFNAR